jgi:signal transduction histidine kinase/CheY-like chemotaxis protein
MTAEAEIRAERVAAAFRQTPLAVAVTVVNGALMAAVLLAAGHGHRVLPWLAAMLGVAVFRLGVWWLHRRRGRGGAMRAWSAHRWGAAGTCAAAATGLLWGGGAMWLWPPSESLQLFWVFVIGGMCAGAAALHHAHLPTALAFILPAGLPVAARFAAEGSERGLAGAAMIVVYLGALAVSGARASVYFGENLRLRLDLARRTRELDATNARLLAEMAEHRATEADLRHAQKMEAVGQLAGGVAHDFNNVLQAVAGGAALIRRRAGDPAAVERLAGMVADAARRGESVTRRLLAFARRGELRAEALDLSELLGGLREVLAVTLGPAVQVEVDAPTGLPPILADRGQLETVLVNLATNARDAMPNGGRLALSAAAESVGEDEGRRRPAPGAYVRLVVADTGTGMDPGTLARASEPFFTTKPQGRGTGLGLPMAQGFAEGSGGALAIDSGPGRGTRVSIWLPVAAGDAARPVAVPSEPRTDGAPPRAGRSSGRIGVLLVDDEPAVREVLAQQLADEGYEVIEAADGAAALALLDSGGTRVDLIVSDLAMPGMDGVAVIREARRRRCGLPAILLTGYAGGAAALAVGGALGDADGNFALVRKPVTGAGLADQVAALLSASRGEGGDRGGAPAVGTHDGAAAGRQVRM